MTDHTPKNYAFATEIFISYHSSYNTISDGINWASNFSSGLDVPKLTEEALAENSGGLYTRVNKYTHDFSDLSDAKTGSVMFNDKQDRSKTVVIKNVENKIGALRIVVFNGYKPMGNQLDYFYIPAEDVKRLWENDGKSGKKKRIRTNWNERTGYSKWNYYRLNSFLDLATKI